MAKNRKKNRRSIAVACAAAVLIVVGSTVAFFSSRDETTNRFAGSRLDIILTETNWNPNEAVNVVPGDELPKNPRVTNNERTPGYIFMRVTVPCGNVTMLDKPDGTSLETSAVNVPLYKFMVSKSDAPLVFEADTTFTPAQKVRSQWKLVSGYPKYIEQDKVLTYVYAYSTDQTSLTPLLEDQTTEPLFDKLWVWNFNQNSLNQSGGNQGYVSGRNYNVLVEAFGIQAVLPGLEANRISDIWALLDGGGSG